MANLKRNQILELDLRVGVQDTGPHWMAFEKGLGIMVFADNKEDAVKRLRVAVDFTMDNITDRNEDGLTYLQSYLDKHGVEYTTRDDERRWVVHLTVDTEETLVATS